MDENKWADEKSKEILGRRKKARLDKDNQLAQWKQKRVQAPELWSQVQEAIEKRIAALRKKLGQEDILSYSRTPNQMLVIISPTQEMRLDFDPDTLKILLLNTGMNYAPHVVQGDVTFCADEGRSYPLTPVDIAEQVLGYATEFLP